MPAARTTARLQLTSPREHVGQQGSDPGCVTGYDALAVPLAASADARA